METMKQLSKRISQVRDQMGTVRLLAGTHGPYFREGKGWTEPEALELAAQHARYTAALCIHLERALLERREELLARQEVA